MPQHKRDGAHRYFTFDNENKISRCNFCGSKFKGKHTSNLKNHLAIKHIEIYKEVLNFNQNYVKSNQKVQERQVEPTKRDTQLNKLNYLCMQLIVVHGRPFEMLNDEPFQEILKLAASSDPRSKEINIQSIEATIPSVSNALKSKMAVELQCQMINLKIDLATCLDRKFLGINIQYVNDNKIIVRNIAVLEVSGSRTRQSIGEEIIDVLNEFMIQKDQIYSVTVDKGCKMKKTEDEEYYLDDEVRDVKNRDESQIYIKEEDSSSDNEEELEQKHDSKPSDNPVDDILNIFTNFKENTSFEIRKTTCPAYTLQLAIKDALSTDKEVQTILEMARTIVKILRNLLNRNLIKLANLNVPIIDCPEIWTSTFDMLTRLVSLKEHCENISEVASMASPIFWSEVDAILDCFRPLNECTVLLQREQLTIGDFYLNWMACKTQMAALDNSLAISLKDSMESRERSLLESDAVLEALYLDGRLNVMLSDEQCTHARGLLKQTLNQVFKVSSSEHSPQEKTREQQEQPDTSNTPKNKRFLSSSICVVEEMLLKTEQSRGKDRRLCSFDASLLELRLSSRLPLETDMIHHYFECVHSDVAKVAKVVLATPASQVSLERLFSSITFIMSPHQAKLSPTLLRDIMFLRSNKDLLNLFLGDVKNNV